MAAEIYKKVYRIVKQIPRGKVVTYGGIAQKLKTNPRTVGYALHANKSSVVPCHRVVDRSGRIASSFAFGGPDEQKRRLEAEGVTFSDKIHVDLAKHIWNQSEHGY